MSPIFRWSCSNMSSKTLHDTGKFTFSVSHTQQRGSDTKTCVWVCVRACVPEVWLGTSDPAHQSHSDWLCCCQAHLIRKQVAAQQIRVELELLLCVVTSHGPLNSEPQSLNVLMRGNLEKKNVFVQQYDSWPTLETLWQWHSLAHLITRHVVFVFLKEALWFWRTAGYKSSILLKVEGEKNMLSERPTILAIVLLVCYINVHKCTVFFVQVYRNHVCKWFKDFGI